MFYDSFIFDIWGFNETINSHYNQTNLFRRIKTSLQVLKWFWHPIVCAWFVDDSCCVCDMPLLWIRKRFQNWLMTMEQQRIWKICFWFSKKWNVGSNAVKWKFVNFLIKYNTHATAQLDLLTIRQSFCVCFQYMCILVKFFFVRLVFFVVHLVFFWAFFLTCILVKFFFVHLVFLCASRRYSVLFF